MPIKVWDYMHEYENEKHEILAAIEKVLESGHLILGENVKQFEESFARYCGVTFGVGVNSGTDALFLGLKALGVGAGDEVITVANTAVPTVSAIVSTGATPVFVDIDPETYLMDTHLLEDTVTEKTKCIVPVHLYGQCVDMNTVRKIADIHGINVIEDCAQAHGASHNGEKAGSMSNLGAFSFYPTKILGGYGDSGIIVTDDEKIYEALRRLRFYGMEKTYYSIEHGYNSRLDELHAGVLLKKLAHLNEYIESRRSIARKYDVLLKNTKLVLPETMHNNKHVYYLYVCAHPQRDEIISELKKRDIFLNISYPWPVHRMSGYKYLGYRKGDLPKTEKAACEIFSLPMYPTLSDDDQNRVVNELSEILVNI